MVEPISTSTAFRAAITALGISDRLGFIDLPGIGSLFGGSDREISTTALRIPKNLRGAKIPSGPLSASSFRHAGARQDTQRFAVQNMAAPILKEMGRVGLSDTPEFKRFKKSFSGKTFWAPSPSAQAATNTMQRAINMASAARTVVDDIKAEFFRKNPRFPSDFFNQPGKQRRMQIDKKKQAGRVAFRAARQFLRFPTRGPQEFQPSGFVSKAGAGFRNISELEQGMDRIIPSGFTSKQATTQSRALALRRLS